MVGKEMTGHSAEHRLASSGWLGGSRESLIHVGSRRWFLKAGSLGCAGVVGLGAGLPQLLGSGSGGIGKSKKSVILFWLSGGPSHIDMWDPKPDAPAEIRGPFNTISTSIPGVQFGEHLPLQASIADQLSIIRSVDCSASNHTPITLQAGNPLARRTDDGKDGGGYPSMGSVAAKFRGSNDKDLPAFVALAPSLAADVWGAGHLGASYDPISGMEVAGKFGLPKGLAFERLQDRSTLRKKFDQMRDDLDRGHLLEKTTAFGEKAYEMVTAGKVEKAFDLSQETDKLRDQYGRASVGEKALLARRLVEAGVTFVVVSGAWGYFDNHGDKVPPWGGIEKGLKPILPTIDSAFTTLIKDLKDRGLLDETLVLMLGEFGRTPVMSADAGRGHWTNCMSMLMAGGGLPHGQVIGSTDSRGYDIASAKVRPQDLAATVFRHLEIDLDSHWVTTAGRPTPIVTEAGRPIPELMG